MRATLHVNMRLAVAIQKNHTANDFKVVAVKIY